MPATAFEKCMNGKEELQQEEDALVCGTNLKTNKSMGGETKIEGEADRKLICVRLTSAPFPHEYVCIFV